MWKWDRSIETHQLMDLNWFEHRYYLTDSIDEIVPVLILSSDDSTRKSLKKTKRNENVKRKSQIESNRSNLSSS